MRVPVTLLALALSLAAQAAAPVPSGADLQPRVRAALAQVGAGAVEPGPALLGRVQQRLEKLAASPRLRETWERRKQVGPELAKAVAAAGLPAGLADLPWVESQFRNDARSEQSAGLWQFIAASARKHGLRVDATVDERLDPQRATQAALRYLKELGEQFTGPERWLLAITAYNFGEGGLRAQLQGLRGGPHDAELQQRPLQVLLETDALGVEAGNYLASLLAALIIAADPSRFGLE